MKRNDEFYVSYIPESLGEQTKKTIRSFAVVAIVVVITGAVLFGMAQNQFKNSSFELLEETQIEGTYHANPYPMLRVAVAEGEYKNILLLGFGKSSANPYLSKILAVENSLSGRKVTISGNLIYYNGKTLIQITDEDKVVLSPDTITTSGIIPELIGQRTYRGEIIDPKCYFGVMKPGKGKIHRSCAVRCISGGIPPVLATTDNNGEAKYLLLTDLARNPINQAILPYIGKPSEISGIVERYDDWHIMKINSSDIDVSSDKSEIY